MTGSTVTFEAVLDGCNGPVRVDKAFDEGSKGGRPGFSR